MAKVLTTIVVPFGFSLAASDFSCQIELDETRNKDSEGKVISSFLPGQICYFLTKCSDNVRITNLLSTWGQINTLGNVSITKTDDLLFVELNSIENRPTLSYVPSGSISAQWIGNVGGPLILDSVSNTVDISSGTIPCYCKASYSVSFVSHKLSHNSLGISEYDIHIVAYLEEV